MSTHAYVKFVSDAQRIIVPGHHIKGFSEDIVGEFKVGDKLLVFYSTLDEEPIDVIRKQGYIPEVDRQKRSSSKDGPPTGYYDAELLAIDVSQEALQKKIDSKRVSEKTEKASGMIKDTKNKSQSKQPKASTKAQEAAVVSKSEKKNVAKLLRKRSRPKIPDTSSDSGSDVEDIKPYEEKIKILTKSVDRLKEKYLKVSTKNEILEDELTSLKEENFKLKVQSIHCTCQTHSSSRTDTNEKHTPKKLSVQQTPLTPGAQYLTSSFKFSSESPLTQRTPNLLIPLRSSPRLHSQQENSTVPSSVTKLKKNLSFNVELPSSSAKYDLQSFDKSQKEQSFSLEGKIDSNNSSLKEDDFKISDTKLNEILYNVLKGRKGDSLFVKNLASAVFGNDVLSVSSVTGKPYPGDKNATGKPALSVPKLNYISDLFKKRMLGEEPKISDMEFKKRESKIAGYISKKIMTLIREPAPRKVKKIEVET